MTRKSEQGERNEVKSGQVQTGILRGTVYQLEVGHRFDSVLLFYFIHSQQKEENGDAIHDS